LTQVLEKQRQRGIRFPTHPLQEAERVTRIVQDKGGGTLSLGATAVGLELSPTSSSLVGRVASAKHFAYLEEENETLKTTQLAKKVLRPTSPETARQARREAFLSFHVFKLLFERFYNGLLPERALLENLLVLEYGVSDGSKSLAYDVFIDSGEFADQIVETPQGLFCGTPQTPGPTSVETDPVSTKQRAIDPKLVELLQDSGSIQTALELCAKTPEEIREGLEAMTNALLERMLELGRELNLPSIKMSVKIALERFKTDGLEGARQFLPYIRDGLKEDLGVAKEF
jgi:hypothetical protein